MQVDGAAMKIAKLGDRLVQIVRMVDRVQFSDQQGWIFIVIDFERPVLKQQQFKWVPASTRFEWVRDFCFLDATVDN